MQGGGGGGRAGAVPGDAAAAGAEPCGERPRVPAAPRRTAGPRHAWAPTPRPSALLGGPGPPPFPPAVPPRRGKPEPGAAGQVLPREEQGIGGSLPPSICVWAEKIKLSNGEMQNKALIKMALSLGLRNKPKEYLARLTNS